VDQRERTVVKVLLFFESDPFSETTKEIAERVVAYRQVLVMSLCFAAYSILASRTSWLAWGSMLSLRLNKVSRQIRNRAA